MQRASDEQIRALTQEILSQPEYARHRFTDPEVPSWFAWIIERLRSFVDFMGGAYENDPIIYWGVLLGLASILALLIVHITYSIRRALAASPTPTEPEAIVPHVDLAAAAARAAANGQYLEGARGLQLACIELLLEDGLIELSRADPNQVLRQRLAVAPIPEAERLAFSQLVDRLERDWFRDGRADEALYDDWRTLYQRLCRLLGTSSARTRLAQPSQRSIRRRRRVGRV